MSPTSELELAQAQASYYHDRVALLRAKHYRWGLGSSPRLRWLQREWERAELRVSAIRSRERERENPTPPKRLGHLPPGA